MRIGAYANMRIREEANPRIGEYALREHGNNKYVLREQYWCNTNTIRNHIIVFNKYNTNKLVLRYEYNAKTLRSITDTRFIQYEYTSTFLLRSNWMSPWTNILMGGEKTSERILGMHERLNAWKERAKVGRWERWMGWGEHEENTIWWSAWKLADV